MPGTREALGEGESTAPPCACWWGHSRGTRRSSLTLRPRWWTLRGCFRSVSFAARSRTGGKPRITAGRRTAEWLFGLPVVLAPLRRAVAIRDSHCRFPRCDRPHGWCDAHHVMHWADGGPTALQNLVLLCRPHHRMVQARLRSGHGRAQAHVLQTGWQSSGGSRATVRLPAANSRPEFFTSMRERSILTRRLPDVRVGP